MQKVTIGAVVAEQCARCGGVWLDREELAHILGAGSATDLDRGPVGRMQKGFAPGGRHCPRDKMALYETRDPDQPHVELDACGTCGGVFLDSGELTDLSEVTLGERLRKLMA